MIASLVIASSEPLRDQLKHRGDTGQQSHQQCDLPDLKSSLQGEFELKFQRFFLGNLYAATERVNGALFGKADQDRLRSGVGRDRDRVAGGGC